MTRTSFLFPSLSRSLLLFLFFFSLPSPLPFFEQCEILPELRREGLRKFVVSKRLDNRDFFLSHRQGLGFLLFFLLSLFFFPLFLSSLPWSVVCRSAWEGLLCIRKPSVQGSGFFFFFSLLLSFFCPEGGAAIVGEAIRRSQKE